MSIVPKILCTLLLAGAAAAQQPFPRPAQYQPSPAEFLLIESRTRQLERALQGLSPETTTDAAVFAQVARMALEEGPLRGKADVEAVLRGLDEGIRRSTLIREGKRPWLAAPGRSLRGYRSRVDGSVQPYSVVLPAGFQLNAAGPWPLEVFLHGRGTSEARFLSESEAAAGSRARAPEQPHIELHPFGRANNGWRWAGETDIFEALREVQRRYRIDPDRIRLRGFSMGGHGAWHVGVHHPDLWSAVSPGAGFTDTVRYQKLTEPLPPQQQKLIHIYDAVDWALNLFNTPFIGYGGEDDPQLQATLNMVEAARDAGVPVKMITGPKTGHTYHPGSLAEIKKLLGESVRNPAPEEIKFTTWTVKYNRCFWVTVDGLEEHYARAEVRARREGDAVRVASTGVTALTIAPLPWPVRQVELDGERLAMDQSGGSFHRTAGGWRSGSLPVGTRKRHGLQGPIDDAFTDAFLVVRPTGKAWSDAAARHARRELERLRSEWRFGFRGRLPEVDDTALTADQIRDHHLILLGDPGSNKAIAQVSGRLPLRWGREGFSLAGRNSAADEIPVLIAPNPENEARYVVLNSGHTFQRRHLEASNAWLFPQVGDWGVIAVEENESRVVATGFADEKWRPQPSDGDAAVTGPRAGRGRRAGGARPR